MTTTFIGRLRCRRGRHDPVWTGRRIIQLTPYLQAQTNAECRRCGKHLWSADVCELDVLSALVRDAEEILSDG